MTESIDDRQLPNDQGYDWYMSDTEADAYAQFGSWTFLRWWSGTQGEEWLESVREWLAWSADTKVASGGVLLDNTTIDNGARVALKGDTTLSAAAFWDLTTLMTSVVVFERIFHLHHPAVDSSALNMALGNEQVFIAVPYDEADKPANALLSALLNDCISYLREIEDSRPRLRSAVAAAWRQLLGADVPNPVYDEDFKDSFVNSDLTGAQAFVESSGGFGEPDIVDLVGDQTYVAYSNMRGLFNLKLAELFGLPYLANAFRLPLLSVLHQDTRIHSQELAALLQVERMHRARIDIQTRLLQASFDTSLPLPFFPAAVLQLTSNWSELFEVLADVRRKATSFRRRKIELDEACVEGRTDALKGLSVALNSDAMSLTSLLAQEALPTVLSLVPSMTAIASGGATELVGILGNSGRSISTVKKLVDRISRPHQWFLTAISAAASRTLNSKLLLERVWGGRLSHSFVSQFTALSKFADPTYTGETS